MTAWPTAVTAQPPAHPVPRSPSSAAGPSALLSTLRPIGLAELREVGDLQTRVDRKYLVTLADLERLLSCLPPGTRVLEIDGRREFGYESVYFDTPEHTAYRQAALKRRLRAKVRTRRYADSGLTVLEVKTRRRGHTVKVRTEHPGPLEHLDTGDVRFVRHTLEAAGVHALAPDLLRPTLRTTYRRMTLLALPEACRVTIDVDLRWSTPGTGPRQAGLPTLAVVETKGGRSPSSVDRTLWQLGLRPTRISKYGTGLAALTDLPAAKWRRVLREHLSAATGPA